ncbi:unnamed protein product [Tenebrio molitor]|nr:unnamed protein product [Tenebrio molitor]
MPYEGARDKSQEYKLCLGSEVIVNLLSVVKNPFQYEVYFDNFFTSYELATVILKERGFLATGTIKDNRTRKCLLEENKSFSKNPRGTFDYAYDNDEKICIVKWHDNSIVNVASNHLRFRGIPHCKYETIQSQGEKGYFCTSASNDCHLQQTHGWGRFT